VIVEPRQTQAVSFCARSYQFYPSWDGNGGRDATGKLPGRIGFVLFITRLRNRGRLTNGWSPNHAAAVCRFGVAGSQFLLFGRKTRQRDAGTAEVPRTSTRLHGYSRAATWVRKGPPLVIWTRLSGRHFDRAYSKFLKTKCWVAAPNNWAGHPPAYSGRIDGRRHTTSAVFTNPTNTPMAEVSDRACPGPGEWSEDVAVMARYQAMSRVLRAGNSTQHRSLV